MARVKRGVTTHARHRKIIKQAKGYRGRAKNCFRVAKQFVERAGQYAYIGRKLRKRDMRSLWIQRINAASREFCGMSYSKFMDALKKKGITVDRKNLAELAVNSQEAFKRICKAVS